jgi:hypothetical protein
MPTNVQTGSEPGLASLATGILHDGQELFKQELRLFRHEVEVKAHKTAEASTTLVIGVVVSVIGLALLGLTLVFLLHEVGHLPLWASFLIIGGGLAVIGGGVTVVGVRQIRSVNPLPEESGQALKETLEWTTNQR